MVHSIKYDTQHDHILIIVHRLNVSKKANIWIRINQVPHLTQGITWESDKKHKNITYKKTKRLALSQQVTTRLQ